jgi:hypothetical protein
MVPHDAILTWWEGLSCVRVDWLTGDREEPRRTNRSPPGLTSQTQAVAGTYNIRYDLAQ